MGDPLFHNSEECTKAAMCVKTRRCCGCGVDKMRREIDEGKAKIESLLRVMVREDKERQRLEAVVAATRAFFEGRKRYGEQGFSKYDAVIDALDALDGRA